MRPLIFLICNLCLFVHWRRGFLHCNMWLGNVNIPTLTTIRCSEDIRTLRKHRLLLTPFPFKPFDYSFFTEVMFS